MPETVRFTKHLTVTFNPTKSDKLATIENNLVWEIFYTGKYLPKNVDNLSEDEFVIIPAGFVSDGVTAPRFLWWIFPPWGHPSTRAAMLHDYLLLRYKTNKPHPKFILRSLIDNVFYESLRACGVNIFLSYLMWISVRYMSYIKADFD